MTHTPERGLEEHAAAHNNSDTASLSRSRTRQAVALGIASLSGIALISAVAASGAILARPSAETFSAPLVSAHPSALTLGCLDASIDPFAPLGSEDVNSANGSYEARAAAATLWHPTGTLSADFLLGGRNSQVPIHPDGRSWALKSTLPTTEGTDVPSLGGKTAALPHGVSLVGQKGGELRGLSLLPCTPSAPEHWFAAGATSPGEDTVIRVANTGSQPSVVTMAAWGASGPLDQFSQGLIVGPGETLSIQPGRYFPHEERLVIRLNADGPGVSAWLHSSTIVGEIPAGSAWVGSTLPSSQLIIPGLTPRGTHTLRLAVPPTSQTRDSAPEAQLTLRLIDATGTREIPGGTLSLAENSVLDIDLPAVKETSALSIESSLPVVANIRAAYAGAAWPSADTQVGADTQRWAGRGLLNASTTTRQVSLPSHTELNTALATAFDAPIVRPTSVPTPTHATVTGQELSLVNPTARELNARYGQDTLTIPAGTSLTLPLGNTSTTLNADEGLYAGILVRADLPTGSLDAVWPLGNVAMSGYSRTIDLR